LVVASLRDALIRFVVAQRNGVRRCEDATWQGMWPTVCQWVHSPLVTTVRGGVLLGQLSCSRKNSREPDSGDHGLQHTRGNDLISLFHTYFTTGARFRGMNQKHDSSFLRETPGTTSLIQSTSQDVQQSGQEINRGDRWAQRHLLELPDTKRGINLDILVFQTNRAAPVANEATLYR
jgi:hypothetical protein